MCDFGVTFEYHDSIPFLSGCQKTNETPNSGLKMGKYLQTMDESTVGAAIDKVKRWHLTGNDTANRTWVCHA
jgi:hypothetical protein